MRSRRRRSRRDWGILGIALGVLGVIATLATSRWQRSPTPPPLPRPEIYSLRVQVLDPNGQPLTGARVRASAGNEPHLLPDGWWEIQVPAAKVPHDGSLSVWAEHERFKASRVDVHLGADPNPRVEIRLGHPESVLGGQVVDGEGNGLAGAHVSVQDGPPAAAMTAADGRFTLHLHLMPETGVRLLAEKARWSPGDVFCYTGRDSCPIVLDRR